MREATTNSEEQIFDQPQHEEILPEDTEETAPGARGVVALRLFWNERRFLLRVAACGLVIGSLVAFLLPKRYESTTRLMPPDSQSSSSLAMMAAMSLRTGGPGAFAGDLLGLKSSGALFVDILRSRTVQDRLVEQFFLKKVYGVQLSEDARRDLSENTSISEDRKSGIITITVTDKNPQRAASLARAYVEHLNRLVAQLTTSAAHRERVFLEERLKAVKEELDAAAKEFSEFASKNTAIDIKEQGRAMVEAAAALQGQLIAAQTELEGVKQIYTENNVRVRSLRARLVELQRQLEKLGGSETSPADGSSQPGVSPYPSIRKLPLLGVTYADLYRQTKIQEVVYETLTQQYELAKVQEVKETPSVRVLDIANLPERKSFPPRLLIIFLCTFFSLAFGAMWVLGRERWREVDSQDPRKALAIEVFAAVRTHNPLGSGNGFRLRERAGKVWSLLRRPVSQPHDGK